MSKQKVNNPGGNKNKPKPKGKSQGQSQGPPKRGKQDLEIEDADLEDMEEDDLMDEEDMFDRPQLFWSLTVPPSKETLLEPEEFVCITHACFGAQVNKGSRTVVSCKLPGAKESIPLCVLTEGTHENQPLDLKFGSPTSFSVKGNQPSTVYLTGYIHVEEDIDDYGDMNDDLDMEELAKARAKFKYGGFPDDEAEEDEEEEPEFELQPTTKKRKIEAPKKAAESKKEPKNKKEANKPATEPTNANNTAANQDITMQDKPNAQEKPKEQEKPNAQEKPKEQEKPNAQEKPLSKNQQKKLKKQKQKQAQTQGQAQTQPQSSAQVNDDTKPNQQNNEKTEGTENKENNDKKDETSQSKQTEKTEEAANTKDVPNTKDDTKIEQPKVESNEEKPKSQKKNTNEGGVKTLPNGIEIKDLKEGTGAEIKQGQTLHIFYVGQLEDKTVFDKVLQGDGFEFKFGNDEVIKGWNLGMKGMKLGGKRRITVPSKFAFGMEGSAEKKVPANTAVTYTIEIKVPK